MKLIVSHLTALNGYVTREFHEVMNGLITNHGWRHIETMQLWQASGSLKQRLRDWFDELPEIILFWESYEFLCAHISEINNLDCHKVFMADDLHFCDEEWRSNKLISFRSCATILSTNAHLLNRFYPELSPVKEVVWIPHAAASVFLTEYNENPENSILLSGAISRHYPLREEMKRLHEQGLYPIAYHRHPGYHCNFDHRLDPNVGRGYAAKLNQHRVCFTDSLTFNYLVAKYFEIPATGALLFADDAVDEQLKQLGFIAGEHYFPVSKGNLEESIRYVLDQANQDEMDAIRKRGQQLVWERHKTTDRARRINEVCAA